MKAKMTIPYQNGCWIVLGCLLVLAILGPLTVTFIVKTEEFAGAAICALLLLIHLGSAWLSLHYGLRISKKSVVLLARRRMKIVPYDAVRELVVRFTPDSVTAWVRTNDEEEICFVWKDLAIESKEIFPGRGWGSSSMPIRVGIQLTDRFVEKSIESLSQCEKVRIENYYYMDA